MQNYYYLATVLPKLEIGVKPDMTFQEFITLLKENLTKADYDKTRRLRWFYDFRNVRAYWKGEPLDYWGNLNEVQLEDAILEREGDALPEYFYKFLDEHESKEERLKYFPQLMSTYFATEATETTGFLRKLRAFERNLRLIATAFRARELGRDLATEFQFEDPEDDVVAQLLAQKDAKTFEPPQGYEDLKPLLEKYYNSPLQLEKALTEYIFKWTEGVLGFDVFSINYILAYMLRFILIERMMRLDKEKGLKILDNIVKEKA
jgi:Protein of unknown function (DUF2764)